MKTLPSKIFNCLEFQLQILTYNFFSLIWTAGLAMDAEAMLQNMIFLEERSPRVHEPAKYAEKAAKSINPKCSPRRIQQPR